VKRNLVLVLNSGSSSVKYSLFDQQRLIRKGIEENIGLKGGARNHREAIENIFRRIKEVDASVLPFVKTIGHRVVHGGGEFWRPVLIESRILRRLKRISHLAPLHNPFNVLGIEICRELLPAARNVAVFDTEFYEDLAPEAFLYALPPVFNRKHKIRRYGFHGISHRYAARKAGEILGKKILRLITCHLGAGSSITAVEDGRAVDTSMGFTPLEGLVMESRSGSIDPAIPIYLIEKLGFSSEEVDEILNQKSGFLGLCGRKDFREILKFRDDRSRLTYRIYLRSVVKQIGSYIALLGGLDGLVFTGGIGEHSVKFRRDVVRHFGFLGAKIDPVKNRRGDPIISSSESKIKIFNIFTDEEAAIATAARKFSR